MNLLNNARVRDALAGGLGGLIGWLPVELWVAPQLDHVNSFMQLLGIDAGFGALAGLCIGLALGSAGGLLSFGFTRRAGLSIVIAAAAGLLGGALGLILGELVYQPLRGILFVGRTIGWAAFGAVLGSAEGITRRSLKGLRNAVLGGLLGGAIGGFAFDLVGLLVGLLTGSGGASRAIALTIVGASIGLFIVVLERALADGLLKVASSGRQEGREFFLDKPLLSLGRDERCDIALLGDSSLLARHATIRQDRGQYVLVAEPGASMSINRVPVAQQALRDGDEIRIGALRLVYRSRRVMEARAPGPAVAGPPSPSIDAPAAQLRYCHQCGNANRVGAKFCARCGKLVT